MVDVHRKIMIAVPLLLHWALICASSCEERIAGGVAGRVGDFPIAVFIDIRRGGKTTSCSGSIIDPQWILTAAHCIVDSDELTVFAGVSNAHFGDRSKQQVRKGFDYFIYPDYLNRRSPHFRRFTADYALVRLDRSLFIDNLSTRVAVLEGARWLRSPRRCTAVGYGPTLTRGHGQLHYLHIDVFHGHRACPCKNFRTEIERYICFTIRFPRVTICPGDSGGPLICDGMVVGIGSFMYPKDQCNLFTAKTLLRYGCGVPGTVSTYLFLCPVLPWIRSFVGYRIPSHC